MSPLDPFPGQILLRVTAEVNGEQICVQQVVNQVDFDSDPMVRDMVQAQLRHQLIGAILDKYQPKIQMIRP